jgi:hypothetical protein
MTRSEFTSQWKNWCDTHNQWPQQKPFTEQEIRHRWWYYHQETSNNWRLQPAGVSNLKKFKNLCPHLTVNSDAMITPRLLLTLSKLQCPWSWGATPAMPRANLVPTLITFTVFGEPEVAWLTLCGLNFQQFINTWIKHPE